MLTLTLQTLAGATRVGSNLGLFGQMHVLFACRLVMLNGSLTVEVFSPVHCGCGINESNASGIRQPFATGTEKGWNRNRCCSTGHRAPYVEKLASRCRLSASCKISRAVGSRWMLFSAPRHRRWREGPGGESSIHVQECVE